MANPPLPTAKINKTGTHAIEVRVFDQFRSKFKRILSDVRKFIDGVPVNPVTVNQVVYEYLLDENLIDDVDQFINDLIDQILMEGDARTNFLSDASRQAYENSTADAIGSLDIVTEGTYPRTYQNIRLTPAFEDRLLYIGTRTFESMKGLTGDMKGQLGRLLLDGMASGENPNRIAARINKNLFGDKKKGTKGNLARAKKIARTEITNAHRKAIRDEDFQANQIGIRTGLMHISALIPDRTRKTHAQRHGGIYTRKETEEWYQKDGNGINCFLPDTKVQGRFCAGSKAFYEGEVIRLVTASGLNLTVTPNHPVMSKLGLIAATEIAEGDYLVANRVNVENPIGPSTLNVNEVYSTIEEVFASLVNVGHSFSRGVSTVDFHGDGKGINKDVDVVNIDRFLTVGANTQLSELLDSLGFKHSNPAFSHGFCVIFFRLLASLRSSYGVMSRLGNSLGVFLAGTFKSFCLSLGHVSPFKSGGFKPSIDCYSGNSNFFGYLKDRFSAFSVLPVKFGNIKSMLNPSDFFKSVTSRLNLTAKSSMRNSYISGNILDGLSGKASLDRVVKVERFFYSGHVYDLQEKSGLMVANGIITSNCLCTQVTVLVDSKGNPTSKSFDKKVKAQRSKFFGTVK